LLLPCSDVAWRCFGMPTSKQHPCPLLGTNAIWTCFAGSLKRATQMSTRSL
jgi:hypothetical protein